MGAAEARQEERETLLIVDDDAINREILKAIFSPDYRIQEAEDGRTGLARILSGEDRLCAVLLDVVMPEMNGLELQLEMKARDIDLPVIFVTGHASVESAVAALRKGAVHYLKKPVDSEDLFAAMEEACSLYCAARSASFLGEEEIQRRHSALTQRQKEVLRLVLEGRLSRDIGLRLGISHRTVLGHRATLNRIFEIRSPADLNRLAEVLTSIERGRADGLT